MMRTRLILVGGPKDGTMQEFTGEEQMAPTLPPGDRRYTPKLGVGLTYEDIPGAKHIQDGVLVRVMRFVGEESFVSSVAIGDMFWDKGHDWCDGCEELDLCGLVLSADRSKIGDPYLWRVAMFVWCGDGYMGANVREFTEAEVLKMVKVGNVADVKRFG